MEISASNPLFPSLTVTRTSGEIQNWQTGQLLYAQVASNVESGLVSLRIGARLLMAQIDAEVEIGQRLALEVITSGDKPVLQGIRNDALAKLIEAALRSSLPKQQSHELLLSDIKALLQPRQTMRIPDAVMQAVRKLYLSFPDKNELNTFTGLKKAIRDSGLFLEPRLASQNRSDHLTLGSDFKAGLLRLQKAIQQQLGTPQQTAETRVSAAGKATYSRAGIFPGPGAQTNPATPAAVTSRQGVLPPGATTVNRPAGSNIPINPVAGITTRYGNTATTQTNQGNGAQTGRSGSTTANATIKTGNPELTIPGIRNSTATEGTNSGAPNRPGSNMHIIASPGLPGGRPATMATAEIRGMTPVDLINRTDAPYLYPNGMPFRHIAGKTGIRPSEKFARLDSLTKILTQLLKDADSSLSRIQLNQLIQHNHTEPEQRPSWLFEIPVRNGDNLDLFRFKVKQNQKENNEQQDETPGWTIQISFNIENLGQVDSKITIHQKQVSIMFWTEQQKTTKTFQRHLQILQQDLEEAGLEIEHLNCVQGCAPEPIDALIENNILDDQI